MQLRWDSNNQKVEERNKSAAFGTGTTPPTIDLKAIGRVDQSCSRRTPRISLSDRQHEGGARRDDLPGSCADCHGSNGPRDFSGEAVGKVTPIEEIGTDPRRLDSYTYELAVNQWTLYAGEPGASQHFRKTFGYANMPLDGSWLRAPYLHNGRCRRCWDLLEPPRPATQVFYRGYDVYDPAKSVSSKTWRTRAAQVLQVRHQVPGNGNGGHEGTGYGPTADRGEGRTGGVLKTF